jgi:hypothetical protein
VYPGVSRQLVHAGMRIANRTLRGAGKVVSGARHVNAYRRTVVSDADEMLISRFDRISAMRTEFAEIAADEEALRPTGDKRILGDVIVALDDALSNIHA